MPFCVRVRDFQSIEDATIEVNGLTVITGPNNSGKTAVIRAIYGAFTNARGTDFVRNGKDSTIVDVEFSDGRKISWEKGKKVNRYEVDGKALERVGAGAPAEVLGLGVTSIEAAGRDLWPQFAHQFVGQIFLLNEPGSVLAEAIANVDKVGVLNEALRLSQSDRKSAASDLKVRREDVTKGEAALLRFEGLDEAVERVRQAEVLEAGIQKLRRARDEVVALKGRFETSSKAVGALRPVRDVKLAEAELVARVTKTMAAMDWAVGARSRLQKAKTERDGAKSVHEKAQGQPLPDPKPVREALERFEVVRALASKWQAARTAVESLGAKVESARKEHDEATTIVKSLFKESGQCPFCGVEHEDRSC